MVENVQSPATKAIAVLDRTKEPGGAGEPLYQDVIAALYEGAASGTSERPSRLIPHPSFLR